MKQKYLYIIYYTIEYMKQYFYNSILICYAKSIVLWFFREKNIKTSIQLDI